MDWKEFFKLTLLKIIIFVLIAVLIFILQLSTPSYDKTQTEELSIINFGLPNFFSRIYHCTSGYSCTEDNEFCFCKQGYKTYAFNVLFLVINLLELYLLSCLIFIKKSLN
jgi:hypothetical protein